MTTTEEDTGPSAEDTAEAAAETADPFGIRVSGSFEVVGADGASPVTGSLQRLLLSLLTVRHPAWTSSPVLLEAMWPGASGDGLEARLHLHVHRLRHRLGADAIERGPEGYRLHVPPDAIDLWRFEHLVGDVLTVPPGRVHERELLVALDHGVELWRGEPFPGVDHPEIASAQYRWTELYLLAQEARIGHLIEAGEHRAALETVAPLAREYPLREEMQALWMQALHSTGQHTRALTVYQQVCADMEDLGRAPREDLRPAGSPAPGSSGPGTPGHDSPGPGTPSAPHRISDSVPGPGAHTDGPEVGIPLRRRLAGEHAAKGRFDDALALLGQVETEYRISGQDDDRALVLCDLAAVVSLTGDQLRAVRYLDEAEELEERTTRTDTVLKVTRGHIHALTGHLEHAWACLQGVQVPELTDLSVIPEETVRYVVMWWRVRSQIERLSGYREDAVADARTAYRLAYAGETDADAGAIMVELASALRDAGDPECFEWFRRSIRYAQDAGRLPLAADAHASIAKAYLAWGDAHSASGHADEGLDIARRCGCWGYAARAAERIADASDALGDATRAAWFRTEALAFYRRVEYPLPREVRERLEDQLLRERAIAAARRE